jgi:hypothetical protein
VRGFFLQTLEEIFDASLDEILIAAPILLPDLGQLKSYVACRMASRLFSLRINTVELHVTLEQLPIHRQAGSNELGIGSLNNESFLYQHVANVRDIPISFGAFQLSRIFTQSVGNICV